MSVLCLDDSDTHLSGHYSCVCHVTVEGTDATLLVAGSSSLALDKKPALRIPPPAMRSLPAGALLANGLVARTVRHQAVPTELASLRSRNVRLQVQVFLLDLLPVMLDTRICAINWGEHL